MSAPAPLLDTGKYACMFLLQDNMQVLHFSQCREYEKTKIILLLGLYRERPNSSTILVVIRFVRAQHLL